MVTQLHAHLNKQLLSVNNFLRGNTGAYHPEQGFPTGGTRSPKGYEDPWVTEQLIYIL